MDAKKLKLIILAVLIDDFEDDFDKARPADDKKRKIPGWLKRRKQRGNFSNLNYELSIENASSYRRWLQLTTHLFDHLLSLVQVGLKKKTTSFKEPISPAERLTITLRYLATGHSFRDLSCEHRIGERTISYIVTDTCAVLHEALNHTFRRPKTSADWLGIAKEFEDKWNVPHCVGALDGKHIVIRKRVLSKTQDRNFKGTESIVLMAIVDADYRFRYVDVSSQGRTNEIGVWDSCSIRKLLDDNRSSLPTPAQLPGRTTPVPYVLVADDAFGLRPYVMKPYGRLDGTAEERVFDYRLSRAKRVADDAFGILAYRFRVFLQPIVMAPSKVQTIILAACALHNYLRLSRSVRCWPDDLADREDIDSGTVVPGRWRTDFPLIYNPAISFQPVHAGHPSNSPGCARDVRDEFKAYFNSETGSVFWQMRFVTHQEHFIPKHHNEDDLESWANNELRLRSLIT